MEKINSFLKSKLLKIIVIVFLFIIIWKYNKLNSQSKLFEKLSIPECFVYKKDAYKNECINLYKKLRNPNISLIIKPPLRIPPGDLLNEFIQNGEMPIEKYWYFNEVYSDSSDSTSFNKQEIKLKDFSKWLNLVKDNRPLHYDNTELQRIMKKYSNRIKNNSMLIIGTQIPWVEAISYELLASKITTLDYTHKNY